MPEASVNAPTSRGNGPNPKPARVQFVSKYRSFLGAYLEELDRLADENYFAQSVGDECPVRHPASWYPAAVQRKIALYGYDLIWPLNTDHLRYVSDDEILKYVEFFYRLVSKPLDEWYHNYCEASHPRAFDEADGKAEYSRRVNDLFQRWNPELTLVDGLVVIAGSQVLTPRLADPLEYQGDHHLEHLVETGIRKFQTGREAEKLSALTDLANALERIKESLGNGNKQNAASGLVENLGVGHTHCADLDNILKSISNLSNNMAIRHHERNKTLLKGQSELVDFLFHMYYNAIRLALSSVGLAKNRSDAS